MSHGRNRIMTELQNKYCNINNETVMAYLKLCVVFNARKKNSAFKNKINIQAILEPTRNLRAQIQSKNYNGYHFHYELTGPPD